MRLCDLGLELRSTWLEHCVSKVRAELSARGLDFRPHFWLSTEWFSPDGLPGVAIPFYLAHPRLMRLEKRQMQEIDGTTPRRCLRLLRHEVGHAIANAYRLHRRKKWRQVFGRATRPYPQFYNPKPLSRGYVLHLDHWYAQSHPSEDFAETFAVWLTPRFPWRKRYAGWPALRKLEFVDEVMEEVADAAPPVRSRRRVEPLGRLRMTLGEYYEEKRTKYGTESSDIYDRDLRRLFRDPVECAEGEPAGQYLRRVAPRIRRVVAKWTDEYQYTVDQVLSEMTARCRQLKLRLDRPGNRATLDAAVLLTVQTMNYLHGGLHRVAI